MHMVSASTYAGSISGSIAGNMRTEAVKAGVTASWMRAVIQAADPHALAALTAALDVRDGVMERLVHTPVPVLLLAGDRDPRLRSIQDTAARISGATCVELPGCGHFDTFLRLDLALPVVRPFLAAYAAG